MIEETLLNLARQRLLELKSYIAALDTPLREVSDLELVRDDVLKALISLTQLLEFSHIQNSGVSDSGIEKLYAIETEMQALSRSCSRLY